MNNKNISAVIIKSLIIFVPAVFSSMPGASFAAGHQPKFVALEFYPFGYRNGGEITGVFTDIMTQIEKSSGIKIAKDIAPIPRASASFLRGDADLIVTGTTSPRYRETISLGVVGCSRIIVATNNKAGIGRIADLESKRIGFVANGFLLRKYGGKFGVSPIQTSSSESLFKMLVNYRADGIFISDLVFDGYNSRRTPIKDMPAGWRKRLGATIEIETVITHLRMSQASRFRHLAPELREAVKTGKAMRTFEQVYRSYGSTTAGRC